MKIGVLVTSLAVTLAAIEYAGAVDGSSRSLVRRIYQGTARTFSTQVIPYACARISKPGSNCLSNDTPGRKQMMQIPSSELLPLLKTPRGSESTAEP